MGPLVVAGGDGSTFRVPSVFGPETSKELVIRVWSSNPLISSGPSEHRKLKCTKIHFHYWKRKFSWL